MLFERGGEEACGQAGGRAGELLSGFEIGGQARAVVTEGAAGGQATAFVENFRGKFAARHGRHCLALATKRRE